MQLMQLFHMSEHIHVARRPCFLLGAEYKFDETFCVSSSLMGDCVFVRITYFVEYRPRHSWHILKTESTDRVYCFYC